MHRAHSGLFPRNRTLSSEAQLIGATLARERSVVTPGLSAMRCVDRLRELGFTAHRRGAGMCLLKKGDRCVIIPDVSIEPEMLRAILRSAGVSEEEFFRTVQRSGVYARTAGAEGTDASTRTNRKGT